MTEVERDLFQDGINCDVWKNLGMACMKTTFKDWKARVLLTKSRYAYQLNPVAVPFYKRPRAWLTQTAERLLSCTTIGLWTIYLLYGSASMVVCSLPPPPACKLGAKMTHRFLRNLAARPPLPRPISRRPNSTKTIYRCGGPYAQGLDAFIY